MRKNFFKNIRGIADFFVSDIAIDLGTANTLVYLKGSGIVLNEPSVVAYSTKGHRKVIRAVGEEACMMLGRTPEYIQAVRPMELGVIADDEIAQKMLEYFIHKAKKKRTFVLSSLRVGICTPSGATAVNKKAIRESAIAAGGKKVFLIEESIAAAVGAGLPVNEPRGSMVVDIGGGTTEIAVVSLGGCVSSRSVILGGDQFDRDIIDSVRRELGLHIGLATAERIKKEIGSAECIDGSDVLSIAIKGRDSVSGIPREMLVDSVFVSKAIDASMKKIIFAVQEMVESTPPELVADIADYGITLTGGGALLRGLSGVMSSQTGLAVHIANNPLECVVKGCGSIMENINFWKSNF